MTEKKEAIKKLRDLFAKKRPILKTDENGITNDNENLYTKLAEELDKINAYDSNYLENFEKIKGKDYPSKMKHVNDLTLNECCTLLTFNLRGERHSPGFFYGAVNEGDILKLLDRAYEIA
ncbi:MAG: hypothetical protein IJQ99_02230 [Synergistaceae bacterium]|nr:hypothetical protein [Synergistaceae bacterium]